MTFDDMCPEGPSQRRVSWCQSNFEEKNNIQSSENLSQAQPKQNMTDNPVADPAILNIVTMDNNDEQLNRLKEMHI